MSDFKKSSGVCSDLGDTKEGHFPNRGLSESGDRCDPVVLPGSTGSMTATSQLSKQCYISL